MNFKISFPYVMIISILLSCANDYPNLNPRQVKENFEKKFYKYKFISADINISESDTVNVVIKFQKSNKEESYVVNQLYIFKKDNWQILNDGETNIINPLPPLIDKTKEQGLRDLKSRNIEIDTVLYQYDNLMTPIGGRKVVLDVIFNDVSIADSITYLQEGEKVSLVLSE